MKSCKTLGGFLFLSAVAHATGATWVERPVSYTFDGVRFESTIVYDAGDGEEGTEDEPRPGILLFPNWLGPATEGTRAKARQVAGDDYVVMIADVWGVELWPEDAQEAGREAGKLRGDRALMRARAARALEAFQNASEELPLDPQRIAAIGFCFGGGVALELGRAGAELDAVVSFHGDLLSPTLEVDAGNMRARVLILHGAADPHVPQEHVRQWIDVMLQSEVDWQLVQFSGAVHSFTDPEANSPGQAQYHPRAAARAFEIMENLFDEVWSD